MFVSDRSSKTSASRLKKPYAAGIPHIQNIDPFSSPANSEVRVVVCAEKFHEFQKVKVRTLSLSYKINFLRGQY